MKQIVKKQLPFFIGMILLVSFGSFKKQIEIPEYSLTVEVNELRNNNGVVVFALYNRDDAFPDEHYKKYFKISILILGRFAKGKLLMPQAYIRRMSYTERNSNVKFVNLF